MMEESATKFVRETEFNFAKSFRRKKTTSCEVVFYSQLRSLPELPASFCNAWDLTVACEATEFVSAEAEITDIAT